MGSHTKGIAYLFICLLMFDALSTQALASPSQLRKNKGMTLNQYENSRSAGKHYAIPNKVLVQSGSKKSRGNSNSSKGGCGCNNKQSDTRHNKYQRCYETIGTCETTINVVRQTQKCVDYVETQAICVQTLREHCTKFPALSFTSRNQRYINTLCASIQVLTRVCKTVQTLVPISVTISKVTTIRANVQSTTSAAACVQTLRPVSRKIRVLTSEKACAKRITSQCGSIRAVKIIHEHISQSEVRSVTCEKQSHSKSNSHSNSKNSNAGGCGCN